MDDDNRLLKDDARVREVTDLGLKYSLLTAYTSFVAIDSAVRLKESETASPDKQPLPLPEGVPESAVGTGFAAQMKPQARMYARPRQMESSEQFPVAAAPPRSAPTPSEPPKPSVTTAPLQLKTVTILSGTLSAAAVKIVFAQDQTLACCAAKAAKARKRQRFVLTLTIDMEALQAWQLPVNGQAAKIRLEIEREA